MIARLVVSIRVLVEMEEVLMMEGEGEGCEVVLLLMMMMVVIDVRAGG